MNFRNLLGFAAILFLPFSFSYAESAVKDGTPRYVETELIPEFESVTAEQSMTFAITQKHAEGWHTYWKNPGDSGETTRIEWTLPKGFKASGNILYPAPEREATGPLMNFGFSGETVLLTSFEVPKTIIGKMVDVTAKISWLVCHDICIPEVKEFHFNLPVTQSDAKPTNPALFRSARAAIPETASWQATLEERDQTLALTFQTDSDLSLATDMFFFPEEWGIILNAETQEVKADSKTLTLTVRRDTRPLSEISTLSGILTYKDAAGEKKAVGLSVPVTSTFSTPQPTSLSQEEKDASESTSLPQALFLALLGGLILNLMPCVFPVLSMKALSLIKMSEREQKHANLHGIFYTLGVLVCFGGIAGLLITLQTAGAQIGWGFQLQNPMIILLLAYLLFTMGLNLSGFFEMKGHLLTNIGHKLTTHHGYKGTFFTGMLATIVATPCTAPFMATAMGYALTQPPIIALFVFIVLGFGLALPYLLLCFIPPLRKSLPKPGAWMETFRQFLSFPMFASVAWLVWVYAQQVSGTYGTLLALSGLLLIAFSIWISKHSSRRQPLKTAIHALSIGAILLALMIAAFSCTNPQNSAQETSNIEIPHIPYTKETLAELLNGNDPIFVDMTAAWCITCKVNERIALSTDATQALFKEKHVQFVVGDWTNENPAITEFLKSYGRNGVPLYVYYGARDPQSGQRPEPKVLPQLLTSGLVADVINVQE